MLLEMKTIQFHALPSPDVPVKLLSGYLISCIIWNVLPACSNTIIAVRSAESLNALFDIYSLFFIHYQFY